MLFFVYRSTKKEGAYLYLPKRDQFDDVPAPLKELFGIPKFVMVMNSDGRQLALVDIEKVKQSLMTDGFFLQLPPPPVNLLEEYKEQQKLQKEKEEALLNQTQSN